MLRQWQKHVCFKNLQKENIFSHFFLKNRFTDEIKKQIEEKKAKDATQSPQDLKSPTSPNSAQNFFAPSNVESSISDKTELNTSMSSTKSSTAASVSASLGSHSNELNYLASLISPSTNSKKQQSIKLDFPEFHFFFVFLFLFFSCC